ncbi:MAG: hypothetical protein ABJC63_14530, partial [Gemmatimonadales bacterium]
VGGVLSAVFPPITPDASAGRDEYREEDCRECFAAATEAVKNVSAHVRPTSEERWPRHWHER